MPKYSVSDLLKCPYFKPWKEVEVAKERGRRMHEMIQQWYLEKHPNAETEVPVEYTFTVGREEYTINGKADIVDPDGRKVIEIKPWTPSPQRRWDYMLQLSFYYTLILQQRNWDWGNPYWIFYYPKQKTLKLDIIRPITIRRDVLPFIKQLAIVREKLGVMPIKGGFCTLCKYKRECKPVFSMPSPGSRFLTLSRVKG
ncbi:MAG: hypothetical protein GXO68_05750 [Crenarchaeota archaeon]|nr:hypothetical protein [Thermoproteota archaeon]